MTEDNTSTDPAAYFQAASTWETSRVVELEKSTRRAWVVASVATVLCALAVIAIAVLLPLKTTTPYVVRVDEATGVPDIVTAVRDVVVTGDDVMVKYWMAKYVRHRETYNWWTLQEDYDTVGLLSADDVGADYAALFTGDEALHETYRDKVSATVDVISVVPTSDNTGTVRFQKITERRGQSGRTERRYVATIAYEFRSADRMTESNRLVNPFGFVVTAYRVDPEILGES